MRATGEHTSRQRATPPLLPDLSPLKGLPEHEIEQVCPKPQATVRNFCPAIFNHNIAACRKAKTNWAVIDPLGQLPLIARVGGQMTWIRPVDASGGWASALPDAVRRRCLFLGSAFNSKMSAAGRRGAPSVAAAAPVPTPAIPGTVVPGDGVPAAAAPAAEQGKGGSARSGG